MNALFAAHSGFRYLVFLLGVVALVVFALGLARARPFTKGARIVGSVFSVSLELQILLGLVTIMARGWQPMLAGHLAMMLLAAAASRGLQIANRKRPTPGYLLPLLGVLLALGFIVVGIAAIGRGPFQSTVGM